MRKIRNFDQHSDTVRALNAQLSAKQISHAYLFCGSEATLKEQLARAFAEAINTAESDGTQSAKPAHSPDIRHYEPDSARGYLVDQIREIIADAQRTPIIAPYKINIITHAEKLTTATANAFLKTLEEPPAYVVNILLAQNAEEVLPTIVSRCQVFNLSDIPQNTAIKMVSEQSGAAPADAEFFYAVANRSINKASEYLQYQQILDLVNFCKRTFGDLCGLEQLAADASTSGLNSGGAHVNALKISDYEVTKYSASILKGIDEITKTHASQLEDDLAQKQEFLDGPAIKHAEKANKRKIAALQTEMLHLTTNVFCVMARDTLKKNANNMKVTKRASELIEELSALSKKLGYNIAPKNYCDVLLLKIAHA